MMATFRVVTLRLIAPLEQKAPRRPRNTFLLRNSYHRNSALKFCLATETVREIFCKQGHDYSIAQKRVL